VRRAVLRAKVFGTLGSLPGLSLFAIGFALSLAALPYSASPLDIFLALAALLTGSLLGAGLWTICRFLWASPRIVLYYREALPNRL
jgi:hypothetical protein